MFFINGIERYSLWMPLFQLLLLSVCDSQSTSVPQVQLHVDTISQMNNTEYVRDVMRQAKSAEMRNYMQPDVNACDDFFQHACGNWAKINPTEPRSLLETTFFSQLLSTYDKKQLKVLMEDIQQNEDEIAIKVKTFFGACQKVDVRQKERHKMKLWEIAEEFGQMPVLLPEGTWEANKFDWLATIARIQNKYGLDIILQLGMREDFVNKTVNKLFIGQPKLALESKAMYKSLATKWHRDKYEEEISEALQKHLDIKKEVAKRTAHEILYFESRLADGMTDKRLAKTLKSMAVLRTVDEMYSVYEGNIDIQTYLNTSLGQEFNGTFYEYHVEYQKNLVQLLKEIPLEQVANYVMYQLLKTFFFDYQATNGAKEKFCLNKTKLYFSKVLDNMIFRKFNDKNTVADINLIWLNIKEIFKSELESNNLSWISSITRRLALEKLATMRIEINSYEESKFNEEYANLLLSHTDYIENLKQVLIQQTIRALDALRQPPRPVEMPVTFSLSPAYINRENLIKIPVILLQPNFLWSDHYPNALKFATIGSLLAHELIHGFDDMGRHFDTAGSEQTWWDSNSTDTFNERKRCFKRQYSLYRYNGNYLPPNELQAENIADNGGIQLAYKAYQKWIVTLNDITPLKRERVVALETLPNLNFTSKQLFFLAFAQFWCNNVDTHFRDKISLISLHAPAKYRVIGPLANFQSFAEEFHCDTGTTMNPKHKSIPIFYILAIVPGLMPWEQEYRFLSFCHLFGSVAPWCGSFIYHLFMNIESGEHVYYTLLKLDMVGIWVSQSFGALPLVTATTFCFSPFWKWFIILSYCLLSLWGLYKALTASSPWQRRLCFALPFTMRSILTLFRTMDVWVGGSRIALSHVYLQDGVSILGGAIGALRIPEKWFPGVVDFYLNSHNIMHVLVVVAVYSMHKATVKDFEWMSATNCNAPANNTAILMDTFTSNVEL